MFAQDQRAMEYESYNPRSTLIVPEHAVPRAKFPFIDVHNHQWNAPTQDLPALLGQMDSLNMAVMVNLSGRGATVIDNYHGDRLFTVDEPEYFNRSIANVKINGAGRILLFTNIEFSDIDQDGWLGKTLTQLDRDISNGAAGLKVYKELGLNIKDRSGRRIAINDARLDPIWKRCGERKIPVIMHSGEPSPFFDPPDSTNERWLELKLYPRRARPASAYPSWETVMNEQRDVFRKNPRTTFIAAHFAWLANDLAELGRMLEALANVYIEFAAAMEEIGRQPKFGRAFFVRYQDRILFGKDTWSPAEYGFYFRMLETEDEYFPPLRKYHAFWRMYGLGLPDDVLKKIYYKNALRIFSRIDEKLFPG
jgi:hypothetical protein